MVIFVTTKSAYSEMENLILSEKRNSVWLASNVLGEQEYENLCEIKNIDISVLNYEVDTENQADMNCALSTIKEHRPG